ncbi:hypothetical protein Vretifemale_97 [Volvox reticuliferus]|uniref:SAC3/GANP/THP3 conserved domain-containing protein n=1 Tax=Volvox reticuliferus TaxID=1737510 RepID=A0A8J4FBA2_9CHLO|nr:hypothetical protein Vretifemale_97 [Volvox reticuliferus]
MAYQAMSFAATSMADSTYYKDYYAAHGYDGGYNLSAYYQQQGSHYPLSGQAAYQQHAVPQVSAAPEVPPPPPPCPSDTERPYVTDAPPLPGSSSSEAVPPLPSQGEVPPPPPPSQPGQYNTSAQNSAVTAAVTASGRDDATATAASHEAYAQWYAQNYGAYYSYQGYEQQWYAYWQQQQQEADAYAYASATYAQQQQTGISNELSAGVLPRDETRDEPAHPSSSSSPSQTYNAQPPPSGLYVQLPGHKVNQGRHRTGATGPNTVPIGSRVHVSNETSASASVAGAPSGSKQHPAIIIRPQVPLAKRAASVSTPSYISVDSSSIPATTSSTPPNGKSLAVAAAVAAGAAGAMAAAKAAQASSAQGSSQWPPAFTAWVTRCFNTARLRNIPDSHLSQKLMAYLEQVKTEGKLWTTDWDTHPIMLPDSPAGQQDRRSEAVNTVLALDGTPARKRNRWGAVSEARLDPDRRLSHDQQPAATDYRKRPHDPDSDEDDQNGERGSDSATPKQSLHLIGGMQSLSNRRRKKLMQMEQHQQQQSGRRGAKGALSLEELRRQARAGRFGNGSAVGMAVGVGVHDDDSSGMDMSDEEVAERRFDGLVVGTCQNLEKSYFRLTSKPDPATVRPEPVLERALERLVSMIAHGEATYFYSLDQFKGMRQDCTVQHLRNGLAVRVYEAHARSSLEYGDTAEFNQCQARLAHLYADGQPGCVAEFTAYRVLYETVHCATAGRRGGGMAKSLMHTIRNIPLELSGSEEIRHALQVREAVMTYNYAAFFRLYASAPHLGRAIMDVVAEAMRWAGLNAFVKACDLPLPVSEMALLLGFAPRPSSCHPAVGSQGDASERDGKPLPGCMRAHLAGEAEAGSSPEEGMVECSAWLRDHGAVVVEKGKSRWTKSAML